MQTTLYWFLVFFYLWNFASVSEDIIVDDYKTTMNWGFFLYFQIFSKLKEKDPDALEKVVVVSGDVTQEDLGMNEDALLEVTREVSVVFHCAAAISFLKPLR